ncbi:MAG: acyloxyacyl hydrolase [Gemmatimonadaceae bacterium]
MAVGCWLVPAAGGAAVADSTAVEGDRRGGWPSASPSTIGPWWAGVWVGAAFNSEFATRLGPRNRDFYLAGIRFGRQLAASRALAVDYFVDVVPLLRSTNNPVEYRRETTTCDRFSCDTELVMHTRTAHGFGVTPVGLQLRAFPRGRVQLVLGVGLGVAWYDARVPDPEEQRLNFMGDLAAGLHVRRGYSGTVLAGIRHNHTSNASTGRVNPGLDSRVVYVGVSRSFDRRSQP